MRTPKTYSAMLAHIAECQAKAETMRMAEAAGVVKRIKEAMAVYGLKPSDLQQGAKPGPKPKLKPVEAPKVRFPKKKGTTRPAKYADDKGNTWAGGGSKPVWLREQLDQGKSIDEFLINKETPT